MILLVEDEESITTPLAEALEREGFETKVARTAAQATDLGLRLRPDLVLLDLMLPDGSGFDVCRALRAASPVPIIILSARGEEADRVVGLELGADDYVVKPFSVRELLLRVAAVLRRSQQVESGETIEFGELRIDRAAHRVWIAGEEVAMTPLEFRLLVTLYERRNRVQTRASLLDDVWDMHADLTTRTVDTHVKRLREKLGSARDYVETVRGVGYRFVGAPAEAARA